jgi:hypothetical protein
MKLLYRGILCLVAALVGLMLLPPEAEANQRRRQRESMQKAQAQMKAYQEDVLRYQREMAAKNEEIMKRFDENGDGKLLGPEKSKYDKYMYDVQKGKEQNPFADIKPPGQGTPATKK